MLIHLDALRAALPHTEVQAVTGIRSLQTAAKQRFCRSLFPPQLSIKNTLPKNLILLLQEFPTKHWTAFPETQKLAVSLSKTIRKTLFSSSLQLYARFHRVATNNKKPDFLISKSGKEINLPQRSGLWILRLTEHKSAAQKKEGSSNCLC